jgi:glutamyl/glutaminyl-tRNA synthetase
MNNSWKFNKNMDKNLSSFNGKIITRFLPEPSGYLHIGHAKALLINVIIAKKYGLNGSSQFVVRFDDTNPKNELQEYEDAIREDIQKLGIKPDRWCHTSDYFDKLIEYADQLVDEGKAYVDDAAPEDVSKSRESGVETPSRSRSVEENKHMWNKMKSGELDKCILRLKLYMDSNNYALRDPTIYRVVHGEHYICGDTYNVYPSYDFACPIVDVLNGITHVYRSTEYAERDSQYKIILKMVNSNTSVSLNSFGKINIQGTVLGKRKIKDMIAKGIITGWDDPSLLTIRGALRAGLSVDALITYVASLGFSKSTVNMTPDALWSINKKVIDKIATRYMALTVDSLDKTKELAIYDPEDSDNESDSEDSDNSDNSVDGPTTKGYTLFIEEDRILKFVKCPELGKRQIFRTSKIYVDPNDFLKVNPDEEVTMMNWGNMNYRMDDVGYEYLELHLEGNPKKTKRKIPWLPAVSAFHNTKLRIIKYKKPGTLPKIRFWYGEPDMEDLKKGEIVQIMMHKYYICEEPYDSEKGYVSLIEIPT